MIATKQQLIASLDSHKCPACNSGKASMRTFCPGCYYKLPEEMRKALFRPLGRGYEQAIERALNHLGVTNPVFPEEAVPGGGS